MFISPCSTARRVAADCDGVEPRRERAPLGSRPDPAALKALAAALDNCAPSRGCGAHPAYGHCGWALAAVLADALFAAGTERAFADSGRSLGFINKAFECLDLIGWEHAAAVLPTVVGQMVAARGAEESTAWRQPVDLVALCDEGANQLPQLFAAGRGVREWSEHAALARELLGDDPVKIIDALKAAIRAGVAPTDLGRSLAYGAALRVARFGTANEHGDWETAHHVFTYSNALDQTHCPLEGTLRSCTTFVFSSEKHTSPIVSSTIFQISLVNFPKPSLGSCARSSKIRAIILARRTFVPGPKIF